MKLRENNVKTIAETQAPSNEAQTLTEALAHSANTHHEQGKSSTIVFIDSAVRDPALIAQAVPDGAEVVLLDGTRDGLEQIAEYLEGRSGIESIHIVPHGDPGELHLGNTTVNSASIAGKHADELAIIGAVLTDSADILIYGCNFSNDLSAVKALADSTGADITASTDNTGAASLGGDWDLKTQVCTIETDTIGGFSITYGEANGVHEAITIETLVRNRTLVLNIRLSDCYSDLDIVRYEVKTLGEADKPEWLEELGPGVFKGEQPADIDELNFTVTITLKDGTKITNDITIQTATGELLDYTGKACECGAHNSPISPKLAPSFLTMVCRQSRTRW